MQTYASILENLSLIQIFAKKAHEEVSPTLRQFMHDEKFVPRELEEWPENVIAFLKAIPEDSKETLRHVEDFFSHVHRGFVESKDADYDLEISKLKSTIHPLKKRLFKFILNLDITSTSDMYTSQNDGIWVLDGTSSNNILDRLDLKSSLTIGDENLLEQENQDVLTSQSDMRYLQHLLEYSKRCIRQSPNQYEALECSISVTLIIASFFHETYLVTQISYEDVKDWSEKLYAIRNSKPKRLEPYMYYVMFHWPTGSDPAKTKSVSDAIESWNELYWKKHPNGLANHTFYFSQGAKLRSLVHRSKLYDPTKK